MKKLLIIKDIGVVLAQISKNKETKMQGKDTINSTFFLLFEPIFIENFIQYLNDTEVDKYVKKLKTIQLIELIAYAQLNQQQGLRDISNSCNNDEFSQEIQLESISAYQISRRLRKMKPEIAQELFKKVIAQTGAKLGSRNLEQGAGNFYILDSSTISLCLSKYPWAEFRKTKSGIKLHLRLQFFDGNILPDHAIITPAKRADKTQMDEIVVTETNALNVFDRGYIDYNRFDYYCENNIRFVSRLKSNALVEVVEVCDLKADSTIKKDQIVYLGKDGVSKMNHKVRLIEVEDTGGNPLIIVTNDFNLSAEEIGDIYRYRWKIELFFKWLKQHFQVKHFYGLSKQAVENQLFISLIAYCLLMLLKLKTNFKGTLLTIKRLLNTCLLEPFNIFLKKLNRKPKHSSHGRRKPPNHEAIYQETVRQVIAGESDHLDDLIYDPILL
jgi:IS4 transposase